MRSKDFKAFKSIIATADTEHSVWWAGYYWLDLTQRQCQEACKILTSRGFKRTRDGSVLLPSGISIAPSEEV